MDNYITINLSSFFFKNPYYIKSSILLSIPTWCLGKLTEWTISNQDYIAVILICIAIDHLIGSFCHAFKLYDFSFKKNAIGLLQKLSLCVLSIILFEIIHYTLKDMVSIFEYMKVITRMIVISYPISSAFTNMSIMTNGKFPPKGWLDRLKIFNETLNIKN